MVTAGRSDSQPPFFQGEGNRVSLFKGRSEKGVEDVFNSLHRQLDC